MGNLRAHTMRAARRCARYFRALIALLQEPAPMVAFRTSSLSFMLRIAGRRSTDSPHPTTPLNTRGRRARPKSFTTGLALMLCAASACPAVASDNSFAQSVGRFVTLPSAAPASDMLQRAVAAVAHIKQMELPQASSAINEALQLDARNSYLRLNPTIA